MKMNGLSDYWSCLRVAGFWRWVGLTAFTLVVTVVVMDRWLIETSFFEPRRLSSNYPLQLQNRNVFHGWELYPGDQITKHQHPDPEAFAWSKIFLNPNNLLLNPLPDPRQIYNESAQELLEKYHRPTNLFAADVTQSNMPVGNIAFNAPEKMELGKAENIQLILSLKQSIDDLKNEITAPGKKIGASIKVAERMEASLTGNAFVITPTTPSTERAIISLENTNWQWEVVPKEKGEQQLHLTLTAIINVNGKDAGIAEKTYDYNIKVDVTPYQWVSAIIVDNKETATGIVAITAFLAGLWNWLKKKRGVHPNNHHPFRPKK